MGLLAEGETAAATRRLLKEGSRTTGAGGLCPHRPGPSAGRPARRPSGGGLGLLERDSKRHSRKQPRLGLLHANAVIRKIGSRRNRAYLTLDASTESARILPTLLQRLGSRSYPVSVPLETRL